MTAVQEEEEVCQGRFYGGNEPSANITVEEIYRICEEPELGEIGFHFVRRLCGNSVIDGKIESISSKKRFVCRFDDGDIHTYLIKTMTKMMTKNFPELRNMSELYSRTSADAEESDAELRESDSEEEIL